MDILGRVYEYFLTQFASAETKNSRQFYTPRCVVRVLVEMIAPDKRRVYDTCCARLACSCKAKSLSKSAAGADVWRQLDSVTLEPSPSWLVGGAKTVLVLPLRCRLTDLRRTELCLPSISKTNAQPEIYLRHQLGERKTRTAPVDQ